MSRSILPTLLIACLLWLAMTRPVAAQIASHAEARIDTNTIRIGEQIRLDLSLSGPSNARVQFPVIGDTLPGLEIVKRDSSDTLRSPDGRTITYSQRFYLTRFDTGYIVLEPFLFVVADPTTGAIDSLTTEAQLISVTTLAVDTTQGIKDIKPILDVPFTWQDALPYVAIGLAALLIGYGIYRYLKQRKKQPQPEKRIIPPAIPAHVRAFEELERIAAEKLWQQGKIKEYHTRVTDVLRNYLEERFGIPAPEMTTDELIDRMRRKIRDIRSQELLRSMLVLADLVKFAKAHPLPDEHEQLLRECREFIELNRPVVAEDMTDKQEVLP